MIAAARPLVDDAAFPMTRYFGMLWAEIEQRAAGLQRHRLYPAQLDAEVRGAHRRLALLTPAAAGRADSRACDSAG
jgi:hypothetical protein